MPSRQHPQSILLHLSTAAEPPSPAVHHQRTTSLLPPLAAASATLAFSLLLLFALCFRSRKKRTVPSPPPQKPPHHFSYSSLRRATRSFSPSLRLGQGGFGSVYRATLPNHHHHLQQNLAVKVMDSGSLQGEREFQNELFFASKLDSPYAVTALGFSYDRKHRSMLLVYELMQNGNLQDALLCKKCEELLAWERRFRVAVDVARGIGYLHGLDPPVIHGDIKPSNVLLDHEFMAKIADFGLSWLKVENLGDLDRTPIDEKANPGVDVKKGEVLEENVDGGAVEESGSVAEETESVLTATTITGFEEFSSNLCVDHDPGLVSMTSPDTAVDGVSASPGTGANDVVLSPEVSRGGIGVVKSEAGKDWWWKQDGGSNLGQNGLVKDYVMEWIGTEIKQERPKSNWIGASSSTNIQDVGKVERKKSKKRLDWWASLDDDKDEKVLKKAKKRPPREWWKEEYCDELEKKKKKREKKERKMAMKGVDNNNHNHNGGEDWWPRDEAMYVERKNKKKKKRSRSIGSRGSVDWLSHDSLSGEIPKSGGIGSTPSMRGTVCYVAPECGGGGSLSEKSDVYSYGVLLLVLIAGRRPLQVISSPVSEFHRANLMHWARHLARSGKLLDLVDKSIQNLDTEQALLCITVALLCLQKSPSRRPSMKEVVAMLTGEADAPRLPMEFSPSPPSRFPFKSKSHMKVR